VSKSHAEFRIFVEGGTKGILGDRCRRGFARFFEKSGLGQRKPKIVACGPRQAAYDDFCYALSKAGDNDVYLLLVDSEGPVTVEKDDVWKHVKERQGDGWDKPATAHADMLHLMVECMESWFLADPEALDKYFGQGFKMGMLPKKPDIESAPKQEVCNALKKATNGLKTKRPYGKGEHSFDILEKVDPVKVGASCHYAQRVIDEVKKQSNIEVKTAR